MSDDKKKNDNSEVLVDQAWRAGDRSKRFYEMTYAGATSFLRRKYSKELNGIPIFLPWQDPNQYSSFHLYVIRLDIKKASISHKDFFIKMRESNILVNLHYIPVYFHPYYQKLGFEKGYCIEAENYYKSAVSIPIFPTLSNDDQSMVIETIKSLIK